MIVIIQPANLETYPAAILYFFGLIFIHTSVVFRFVIVHGSENDVEFLYCPM